MPDQGRLVRRARLGRLLCVALAVAGSPDCGPRGMRPSPEIDSLTVALPHELITLDPHSQDTLSMFAILGNVYEALVSSDATLQLQPGLAERWESPDRLTWLFKLRRGVRFHDGHELDAADVVYTLRRLLDDPSLDVRGYVWNVASVEALSAHTLRLRTHTPWPTLLAKLTQVYVVRAGSDSATLARVANGTGPYRLSAWRPGHSVRLARFEGYWGRRPAVRDALLLQRDCAGLQPSELEGVLDIAGTACGERLLVGSGWRVERRAGLYVKYLGMDVARPSTPYVAGPRNPFRDLRVRQALSMAIDREALVRGLARPARPAFQPVPMSVLGFDPRLVPAARDPVRARRLLAEAGFPKGFDVTLQVRALLRQSAPALAADLAAIGVRVRLEQLGDAAFAERLSKREASLWLSRFGCVAGDASDLFEAFFGGVRRFSVHGGYSDPELERAFAASAQSESDLERRDRLQQLVARLARDLPLVPLYHDEDVYLIRPGLDWQPRNDGCMRVNEVGSSQR